MRRVSAPWPTNWAGQCAAAARRCLGSQAFEDIRSAALQRFGRVDIVANNVGVLTNGLPQDIPVTEWQRILDINLMSVVRSNAAFLPLLLEQGSGHLVNTASFAGLFTYSYDRLPYAASKAAIVQISEGLAIYLRPKNIGVTLLCPGPVLTNIAAAVPRFGGGAPLRTPGEQFELLDPAPVGELVADAILRNRFFVPTHPHVVDELRRRVEDWDAYIDYQISREPRERHTAMTDTRTQGLDSVQGDAARSDPGRCHQPERRRHRRRTRRHGPRPCVWRAVDPPRPGSSVPQPGDPRRAHRAAGQRRTEGAFPDRAAQRLDHRGNRRGDLPHDRLRGLPGGSLRPQARTRSPSALMNLGVDADPGPSPEETRTGDLWLFRGGSGPDRAIQTLTNAR